jgi:hypothetical protein
LGEFNGKKRFWRRLRRIKRRLWTRNTSFCYRPHSAKEILFQRQIFQMSKTNWRLGHQSFITQRDLLCLIHLNVWGAHFIFSCRFFIERSDKSQMKSALESLRGVLQNQLIPHGISRHIHQHHSTTSLYRKVISNIRRKLLFVGKRLFQEFELSEIWRRYPLPIEHETY